jgi:competence protein ComEA
MISIGAKGTDEQFERVMRVLERTLTKVNVNTATAEEIAPVIDVSNATAQAVVKYRTEHGKFKTVDDLKKVPGLDAAKVETRRDRIML